MDKISSHGHGLSIRKSLVLYVIVFAFLALLLSAVTASVCDKAAERIRSSYPSSGERYYLTNEQGEQLGEGVYVGKSFAPLSKEDERRAVLLGIIPVVAAPLYSALSIIACALLFYRNKLKKPLAELLAASEKISNNDLDFSIKYNSRDELGQLCASFETMRSALAKNFSLMWRQAEERKRLNAAFAHDLRTPLTVLSGYNEMLLASKDAGTIKTAATMGRQIDRMKGCVSSMSRLQSLEDTQPEYKPVLLKPLISSLCESANILCSQNGKEMVSENEVTVSQLSLDSSFVFEVCQNLVSNAVRYAKSEVKLSVALQDGGLVLCVSDDGKGFDECCLHKAASPYFTEEKDRSQHFGLGLYICKLLCKHHGGYLRIDNTQNGARVAAFFKSPDL